MAYTPNHVFRTKVTMATMAACFIILLPINYFFENIVYELAVVSVLIGLVVGVIADMKMDDKENHR
jgi:hypothetical protein